MTSIPPGPQRRIRVIIVNFNGGAAVMKCLDALAAIETVHDVEVVVLDNASADNSVATMRVEHPEVTIRETGSNLGFVANNLALTDLADVDYVALLNNDAFVEPHWLDPLVQALDDDSGLGAVQSKIVFAERSTDDGRNIINNVGGIVLADGSGADRGFGQPDTGQFDEPAEIFTWCGGSVLLRPSYLADVGLFDSRLFLYYEDTDLAWRGQSRGWRYRYEPTSMVLHLHAASTGTGIEVFQYFNERNRLVVLVKNAPRALAWSAAYRHPLTTLSYLRSAVTSSRSTKSRLDLTTVRIRLRAYVGFLRLVPAALLERRHIRQRRTVPMAQLTQWIGRS